MNDEDYDVIYVPSRTPSPMMSGSGMASRSPSPNWIPAYSLSMNASNTVDSIQRPTTAARSAGQSGSLLADRTSENGVASKRRRTADQSERNGRRLVLPDGPVDAFTRPFNRRVVLPDVSEYSTRPVAIVLPVVRPCVRRMSSSSDSSATTDSSTEHLLAYGPSIGRRREILHVPEFDQLLDERRSEPGS